MCPGRAKDNTISCSAAHHFYEGRWLRDRKYLSDYARFWFRKGGNPRLYSFWAADSIRAWSMVTQDQDLGAELFPDLVENYRAWEKSNRGRERPVLADRRPRWHGDFHRRQWLPADH